MIFLTVGTIFPFDRLVKAVDAWASKTQHEVFGQLGDLGARNYYPQNFPWTERLEPTDFKDYLASADIVVSHAGVGTIVSALSQATPILILPRKPELHEVVNDHQIETARRFADRAGVSVAFETDDIPQELDLALKAASEKPIQVARGADDSLIMAIQDAIFKWSD